MDSIRIAGLIEESIVDGPGIRFTIFTQGCMHNCYNCHNPQTHDPKGGYLVLIDEIIKNICENKLLSGVTISGGEPFLQPRQVFNLVKQIKNKTSLNILVYTGYTFEELQNKNDFYINEILSNIDILIDGKYIDSKKNYNLKFRGSTNQRIIDILKSLQNNTIVQIEY